MEQPRTQADPPSSRAPRILVVFDDEDLSIIYSDTLDHHGYHTFTAASGEEALTLAKAHHPLDVALVDVMLPGISGREVAARLREQHPEVAIIFVTALDEVEVAVEERRRGAFHYLTKPLELQRLLEIVEEAWAACRARRQVRVGELVVDLREGRAALEGRPIPLTPRESELLTCLARRRGEMVSYEELWEEVWGYEGSLSKGVVQRAVSRLREKLGGEGIVCVRGQGYRLG